MSSFRQRNVDYFNARQQTRPSDSHARPTRVELPVDAELDRRIIHNQLIQAPTNQNPRPDLPKQTRSNVLKRHSITYTPKVYKHKKHRPPIKNYFIAMVSVTFAGLAVMALVDLFKTDHNAQAQTGTLAYQTQVAQESDTQPDETKPDIDAYQVAKDLPRFLQIDKLGIKARVQQVGISSGSLPLSPGNLFDVGWYSGSSKPGSVGAAVMNGYIAGSSKRGVFYNLGSLAKGDTVVVEMGNGQKIEYLVKETKTYKRDKVNTEEILNPVMIGKNGLNLISTGGRYNIQTNSFEDITAVFAIQNSL